MYSLVALPRIRILPRMRSKSISPYLALVLGSFVVVACASNNELGNGDFGLGTAGAGGTGGPVGGGEGEGAGGYAGDPGSDDGEAGQAGQSTDEPPPGPVECADPATTEGCAAYCAVYEDECGSDCNAATTCAPPKGFCAESESAYRQCIADEGTFKKGADGCGVVTSCKRDASLCKVAECKVGATNGAAGASGKGGASSGKGGAGGKSGAAGKGGSGGKAGSGDAFGGGGTTGDCVPDGGGDPFGGGGSKSGGCAGSSTGEAFGGGGMCVGAYESCLVDSDCCSDYCEYDFYFEEGYCIGDGPVDPPEPTCKLAQVGENCDLDGDCCSEYCFSGKCKLPLPSRRGREPSHDGPDRHSLAGIVGDRGPGSPMRFEVPSSLARRRPTRLGEDVGQPFATDLRTLPASFDPREQPADQARPRAQIGLDDAGMDDRAIDLGEGGGDVARREREAQLGGRVGPERREVFAARRAGLVDPALHEQARAHHQEPRKLLPFEHRRLERERRGVVHDERAFEPVVVEHARRRPDARVLDEHRARIELVGQPLAQGVGCAELPEIGHDHAGLDARRHGLFGEVFEASLVPRDEEHATGLGGVARGERADHGVADAAGGAGDDEIVHRVGIGRAILNWKFVPIVIRRIPRRCPPARPCGAARGLAARGCRGSSGGDGRSDCAGRSR